LAKTRFSQTQRELKEERRRIRSRNLCSRIFHSFWCPTEKRIALINNVPFAKDEEGEVKAGNGKVKIRVLEIGDKSVTVSIAGTAAPKELLLQETLLPINK